MSTREQLLDCGERLVRTRGYDGFSYADLAGEVGIRKASIHHHFPKKADLGLALIERYRESFGVSLAAIEKVAQTAGSRLAGYIEAYKVALMDGEALCLCVALSAGSESLSDAIRQELHHFHTDGISWLTNVFKLGREDGSIANVGYPAAEAAAALATVEGGQLMARAAGTTEPFNRATAMLRSRTQSRENAQ